MLFRKHIVSTRKLLQMAVATIFSVAAVGAAFAANSGTAPLLVPYTVQTIAGTPTFAGTTTSVPVGYYGEAILATPTLASHPTGQTAVLNGPYAMTVDSVGNVYIADTGNYIIREVNAVTGLITTVAGIVPKGCSGVTCTLRQSGCVDGVPAAGAPIGSKIEGIAVDAYGNVYFADATSLTVSVIYRGGTRVADFINRVDPAGVAASGGSAKAGYVYHVAGSANLSTCAALKGTADNGLAFTDTNVNPTPTASFNTATNLFFVTLDSAGNLYVSDSGNATTRVINTQETAQTFFQFTVQPGYMKSIMGCNAGLTVPCPSVATTSLLNTGINGPAEALVFSSQWKSSQADAYGNVYELNGTGSGTAAPGIYAAAAYAGGSPLTTLIQAESPTLAGTYGPNSANPGNAPAALNGNGLPTYGSAYTIINNPSLSSTLPSIFPNVMPATNSAFDVRPSSLAPDNFGTFWYMDNHYPELNRIDQSSSLATLFLAARRATANITPLNTSPAFWTNPYYCVYGSTGSKVAWTQGPQTYDPQGDGCPAVVAAFSAGDYQTTSDGLANVYVGDGVENLEREMVNGNYFPATPVNTAKPVTQAIQVHFNSNNPPALGAAIPDGPVTGNTTTAFSIAPGIGDFTIDTTDPEFPMGSLIGGGAYGNSTLTANFQMWAGLPTCTQFGVYPTSTTVTDLDCLVYVTFNPTAPGVRRSQLTVTTANGSVYNFALYGVGTGGQLAIDGGTASPAVTGLGTVAAVAVNSAGTMYIADPTNNRIVVKQAANGPQTALTFTGVTPATLSGPMGVALDSANSIYISDTGNNRILKVDPVTNIATVLGNNVWIPGGNCYPVATAPGGKTCPTVDPPQVGGAPTVTATTPPPQYAFKKPQGLAVDSWNNVYVADTGNSVIVEIPSNIQLGGAVPLLSYPNAPKFSQPVAVAIDSLGSIYVADNKSSGGVIVILPPGGGDLVSLPGASFPKTKSANLTSPNGVAVDAAGNIYASDSATNQVVEIPSASGAAGTPFSLNLPGLSAPAGLALDASGNLYIADSGNKQILVDNRQNPVINFGTVPQNGGSYGVSGYIGNPPVASPCPIAGSSTPCTGILKVTNIGNSPVVLTSPITAVSGTGNPAYKTPDNCVSPLPSGATCTISPTFTPTADNQQMETVSVNGGPQTLSLIANGEQPLVSIVLSAAYSVGTTPTAGATATITATVTQPNISVTPSGNVTFTYTINASNNNANNCGTGGTQTVPLVNGTASFQLPVLAQGVQYTVNATYNGDGLNSFTLASPLVVTVPGIPVTSTVTSTAAQLTFTYGGTPPTITGTVTPTPASPVTYSFGSAAKATTPIGNYPVVVSFSGAGSCAYGFPPSSFSTGGAALVKENPAPLSYTLPNFTSLYGAADISYGAGITAVGGVNGDSFSATFVPPSSSILNVGTYQVVPTVTGPQVGNYTVTAPPSTLTITPAPVSVGISAAKTAVLNTAAGVASATFGISISSAVPSGKGVPSGTVVVTDAFAPITSSTPPVPTPNFYGSATNANLITITDPNGTASIYYTLDGTTPTSSSTAYTAPVTVTATQTLKAIATVTAGSAAQSSNVASLNFSTVTLVAGFGTYVPTNTTSGLHQYSFAYSGDSNFQAASVVPSSTAPICTPAAPITNCLVVDSPDFTLTSTTGPVLINPGTVPSGNGLPVAPNQLSAFPQSAVLFINSVLSFTGTVTVGCTTQSPTYVTCFMTPTSVCFATTASAACTNTATTAATVVAIQTPTNLPLGFFGQTRTSATKTVLAFLPFGVLAFCLRRRKRLSKALWMLITVAAISAGMSGCGGNQVAFYTPIPTGAQTVTVTASYTPTGASQPTITRTFVVPIAIE